MGMFVHLVSFLDPRDIQDVEIYTNMETKSSPFVWNQYIVTWSVACQVMQATRNISLKTSDILKSKILSVD